MTEKDLQGSDSDAINLMMKLINMMKNDEGILVTMVSKLISMSKAYFI